MRAIRTIALFSLIFTLVTAGCQNTKPNTDADRLAAENAQLRAQLNAANSKPKEVPTTPKAAPTTAPALAGLDTSYDKAAGTLTVTLPGDVLFASGQATLKTSARTSLDQIVTAIQNDYTNRKIRIDGYTDSDPVVRTKAKWGDNQALSEARARAVYSYLIAHGVNAANLTTVGHGSANPKATKAKSRRVEVVVQVR